MRVLLPICRILCLLAAMPAMPQGRDDLAVKARVTLAIVRFVEFPEREADAPLNFCVVHDGALPPAFSELIRQSGAVSLVELKGDVPAVGCDVLYVDSSATNWRKVLAQPRAGTLTIGDASGFLAAGGAIELVVANDSVRFDVNQRELKRARVRMSAQALRLARMVRD